MVVITVYEGSGERERKHADDWSAEWDDNEGIMERDVMMMIIMSTKFPALTNGIQNWFLEHVYLQDLCN